MVARKYKFEKEDCIVYVIENFSYIKYEYRDSTSSLISLFNFVLRFNKILYMQLGMQR